LDYHPTFSRHDNAQTSLTSFSSFSLGKVQTSLTLHSLVRHLALLIWLIENVPSAITSLIRSISCFEINESKNTSFSSLKQAAHG